MITVLILCPGCGGGGSVAQVALNHVQVLSDRFQVVLVSNSLPDRRIHGVEYVEVLPREFNWLRRFCHVPNELGFRHAMRKALVAMCRWRQVDVVMCHSHSLAEMAGRLKNQLGFRVVMTTHGDIFDRPPRTYSRDLTWFYRRVTPKAYALSDRVQALSPHMAGWAKKGGAAEGAVFVIPNGVEPAEIGAKTVLQREGHTFLRERVLRLLYVGSLLSVKGVGVLIRAVHKLVGASRGETGSSAAEGCQSVELCLVGDGPERSRLKALADELGLAEAVRFSGRLPRIELAARYAWADLLCIPSLSEALPTVALEAMCCGLPVVGSDIGGIAWLVQEGDNGYLAGVGDADLLAAAIARAAVSRENLARLGSNAYAKARKHHTWEQVGKQLESLVLETLAER